MPRPFLSIVLTREQSIDERFVCERRFIHDKRGNFFWRWRESGEIKRRTTNEYLTRCLHRGLQILRFDASKNESIDVVAAPRLIAHRRRCRLGQRAIGPPRIARVVGARDDGCFGGFFGCAQCNVIGVHDGCDRCDEFTEHQCARTDTRASKRADKGDLTMAHG